MPGEHGDHVGDDEGGGRPGHQEEGDEGHSLQEAQHRAAGRALRAAGRGAGLSLAAPGAGGSRHVPAHQAAATQRTAPGCGTGGSATAGAGAAPEGGHEPRAESGEGCGPRGGWPGWVGGWGRAGCERSEVTKRCPRRLGERGDLPADARQVRGDAAPFAFGSGSAGVSCGLRNSRRNGSILPSPSCPRGFRGAGPRRRRASPSRTRCSHAAGETVATAG